MLRLQGMAWWQPHSMLPCHVTPFRSKDVAKGPNWVNRAHWSTKENRQTKIHFLHFSGPWKKWAEMAPNAARSIFFLLIQTLPTFWATRILILIVLIAMSCWIPNFWISRSPYFQIPRFPAPHISKLVGDGSLSDPNLNLSHCSQRSSIVCNRKPLLQPCISLARLQSKQFKAGE